VKLVSHPKVEGLVKDPAKKKRVANNHGREKGARRRVQQERINSDHGLVKNRLKEALIRKSERKKKRGLGGGGVGKRKPHDRAGERKKEKMGRRKVKGSSLEVKRPSALTDT